MSLCDVADDFVFFSFNLAFCQGLAFDLCVSTLLMKRSVLLRKTSCSARSSRSWLTSHETC